MIKNTEKNIIIYQMGRVGSKTIEYSLKERGLSPFHVHTLNHDARKKYDKVMSKYKQGSQIYLKYKKKLTEIELLQEKIRTDTGKRWKIITLVREPVGRNVSLFFHYLRNRDRKRLEKLDSINALKKYFIKKDTLDGLNYHNTPLQWLDDEMKEVFGIDVYQTHFPCEKGYEIYTGENADVLLIRMESLNNCYNQAFNKFMGLDDFSLAVKNVARKGDCLKCEEFLATAVLPTEYLDRMYTSRYATHFYSQAEIKHFREEWM